MTYKTIYQLAPPPSFAISAYKNLEPYWTSGNTLAPLAM